MKIDFEAVGKRMLDRKKELLADGFPSDVAHAMVAKANGKTDSPAARRKVSTPKKTAAKSAAGRERKTGSHASH